MNLACHTSGVTPGTTKSALQIMKYTSLKLHFAKHLGVSESKSINHQLTQRTCPPDPRPTLTLKKVDGQWQVK